MITTPKLLASWAVQRDRVLHVSIALMAIAACVWLTYEFWRLLFQTGMMGAVDLGLRHRDVHTWFAGYPLYEVHRTATYPPASMLILWPLMGWLSFAAARWLWAATTLAAIGCLVVLVVRECRPDSPLETRLLALVPLATYGTGATIGNGQLMVHFLPMLIAGLLLIQRGRGRWRPDLIGSALVLAALVKPSVTAPFFWIVLLVPGRLRPALLVGGGYLGLTIAACAFQEAGPVHLCLQWLEHSSAMVPRVSVAASRNNLLSWTAALGQGRWQLGFSLLALGVLAVWIYRHRRSDIWLLLAVTAFVSRLWMYHGWYDDVVLLLPMVALYRIAKQDGTSDRIRTAAGILFVLMLLSLLAPGGLYLFPPPWNQVYTACQAVVWLAALGFLIYRTPSATGASCVHTQVEP